MFKHLGIMPSNFNFVIRPITELPSKRSDKDNGYFIVDGLWNTCFFRIAKNKDRFEIMANNAPKCAHTYTKIPAALVDKVYFVYVNYQAGYWLHLPAGAIVIGMHEAQPHKTGGWKSQACLVYCPQGMPELEEATGELAAGQIMCERNDKNFIIDVNTITRGHNIRYIAVNEDGYIDQQSTRPERIPAFFAATQKIQLPDIKL
jgi:hypothetical protein